MYVHGCADQRTTTGVVPRAPSTLFALLLLVVVVVVFAVVAVAAV